MLYGSMSRSNGGYGIVQERAFVGVAAAGLWWHGVHQRHAAGAGDDAFGGQTADYLTICISYLTLLFERP